MISERSSAELWDDGCKTDEVRNVWLIPALVRILNRDVPANVLDVGSATGFVPRSIDARLSYRPSWTLTDCDQDRLALAERTAPANMDVKFLQGDFLACKFDCEFDCAIASFSLLEMEVPETFSRLAQVISPSGKLHVAQPDAWVDVLAEASSDNLDPSAFLGGRVSIRKIDRFTRRSYPFHAMRTERLIFHALEAGFCLSNLLEEDVNGKRNYLLSFEKRDPSDA